MKISDNEYFKELIDHASDKQEHITNFSHLLEMELSDAIKLEPNEVLDALHEILMKEIFK